MKLLLNILEKLDARDTYLKRGVYKVTRKLYDRLFNIKYGDSPYNYERWNAGDL